MNARLNLAIGVLAAVAVLLAVLLRPSPPPPQATPEPRGIQGPYEPWPFSFPKMLPGLVLLDDAGGLAIGPEQAKQMLPLVDRGGRAWRTVRDVEIKMRRVLTPQQDAWMSQHKHEFEVSTAGEELYAYVGTPIPGENLNVQVALMLCRKVAPASPSARAQANLAEALPLSAYTQHDGQEWLTIFDQGMGYYRLQRDAPALALSREQADMLLPLLEAARGPLAEVKRQEEAVGSLFRPDQVKYVQSHMPDLYRLRTTVFAYSGKPIADDNPYRDVVFFKAAEFLRTKIGTGTNFSPG